MIVFSLERLCRRHGDSKVRERTACHVCVNDYWCFVIAPVWNLVQTSVLTHIHRHTHIQCIIYLFCSSGLWSSPLLMSSHTGNSGQVTHRLTILKHFTEVQVRRIRGLAQTWSSCLVSLVLLNGCFWCNTSYSVVVVIILI